MRGRGPPGGGPRPPPLSNGAPPRTPTGSGDRSSARSPPTPGSAPKGEDPRRSADRPRRGSSARRPQKLPDATVVLNIYDVVEHPFAYSIGKWMTLGIHHTGIQVGMREFAFTRVPVAF